MSQPSLTPPEVTGAARNLAVQSLPEKSKGRYEDAYNKLMAWLKETYQSEHISANTLAAYFIHLADSGKAGSTLMIVWSSLHQHLKAHRNIDIKKFEGVYEFVEKRKKNHVPKKATAFTREEVDAYLRIAGDKELHLKLIFAFGVIGCLRKNDLYHIKAADVVDLGLQHGFEVKAPPGKQPKWKTFWVLPSGEAATDVPSLCRRYLKERPEGCPENFFLRWDGKRCVNQVIGETTIGSVTKLVASSLGTDPTTHTSHAMRRTSATLAVEGGATAAQLMRHGNWKNQKTAEGYVAESDAQRKRMAEFIQCPSKRVATVATDSTSTSSGGGTHITATTVHVYNFYGPPPAVLPVAAVPTAAAVAIQKE